MMPRQPKRHRDGTYYYNTDEASGSSDSDAISHSHPGTKRRLHNVATGPVRKRHRFPSHDTMEDDEGIDNVTRLFREIVRLKQTPKYRNQDWRPRLGHGVWDDILLAFPSPKPTKWDLKKKFRPQRNAWFGLEPLLENADFAWDDVLDRPVFVGENPSDEDKAWKELPKCALKHKNRGFRWYNEMKIIYPPVSKDGDELYRQSESGAAAGIAQSRPRRSWRSVPSASFYDSDEESYTGQESFGRGPGSFLGDSSPSGSPVPIRDADAAPASEDAPFSVVVGASPNEEGTVVKNENRSKGSAMEAIVLSDDESIVEVNVAAMIKQERRAADSAPARTARKTTMRTNTASQASVAPSGRRPIRLVCVNQPRPQSQSLPTASVETGSFSVPRMKGEPLPTPSEERTILGISPFPPSAEPVRASEDQFDTDKMDDREAVRVARKYVLQEACLTGKGKAFMGRFLRDPERAKEFLDFKANGIQADLIKEELKEAHDGSLDGLWMEV